LLAPPAFSSLQPSAGLSSRLRGQPPTMAGVFDFKRPQQGLGEYTVCLPQVGSQCSPLLAPAAVGQGQLLLLLLLLLRLVLLRGRRPQLLDLLRLRLERGGGRLRGALCVHNIVVWAQQVQAATLAPLHVGMHPGEALCAPAQA